MRELARIFIAVGTQSVGGGTSTLFLLRRFLVGRERRISEREFTEAWALCQLSPGIHLVAFRGPARPTHRGVAWRRRRGRGDDGPRGNHHRADDRGL